ncbi:MAG: cell wall hydrolase [Candidatus Thiodiazotropha endolucinida]|nr:cell wall hydrolase [Candidatus Thiodiazotropha taylori]MCW4224697.1 cell wall hydrolase [Candidatus Thiodiazotropha endolucinida]MCG7886271.1 cell wall hydrolase [Candidatus Thiodiazotropha taylori]MCG7889417.1 cell wall hydrolase [Candidatus Thiodiazotropha taylori]MCG7951783.1 cell wall hydrolase [Candidatus Thiodiazotropha taylori]
MCIYFIKASCYDKGVKKTDIVGFLTVEHQAGFSKTTTMKNNNLQHSQDDSYPPKVVLFLLAIISTGNAMAEEIIEPMNLEDDLRHWHALYQPPEVLEISKEIDCLARNIYFEARSESEQGQLAVGHVVMNRVAHEGYPDSVCAVVKQGGEKRRYRCQFSWWCDGRSDIPMNKKAWQRSQDLAEAVYRGQSKDPTDGALWYHADYVNPVWSTALVLGKKIGQHLFYLSKKRPVYAMNSATRLQSKIDPVSTVEQSLGFPAL